jgi:DNA-directed RNA polymerase subunit RPC12/RpoP
MAEYINREALLAEYDRVHVGPAGGARKLIEEAPAADVVPVVHGRWEIKTDDYDCEYAKCSACGEEFYDANEDTIDITFNYCPNCGARMKRGVSDEG